MPRAARRCGRKDSDTIGEHRLLHEAHVVVHVQRAALEVAGNVADAGLARDSRAETLGALGTEEAPRKQAAEITCETARL